LKGGRLEALIREMGVTHNAGEYLGSTDAVKSRHILSNSK